MHDDAPAFLTDNSHVLLSGVTGSGEAAGGKTATANWWADRLVEAGHFDYAVAFDPKGRQFRGTDVTGVRDAASAVEDGARRLDWSPEGRADLAERHDMAARFVEGTAGSVVMVHDDAALYADGDGLAWATALGGNPGPGDYPVKSLVVTQDPWDLPRKAVRANLANVGWVGPMTDDAARYFDVMQKSGMADVVRAEHDAFWWSVHDGAEVHTFTPVPGEYADG
jgi:hypothetical protein